MLGIVAPGQGAQTPGFLTPWLSETSFTTRIDWLSAVAGLDLAHYGTKADAETIRDTAIAQPLLVAAGLVTLLELFPAPADAYAKVGVAAGHSVGEITAAAGVGVLSAEQAMVFVTERGKAMAAASAAQSTSMAAVIGGELNEVLDAITAAGLTAANNNGTGQIVAAGTIAQLETFKAAPPTRTRIIPLSVAGAFHTVHMEPAVARLAQLAKAITTHDPRVTLLSNADGAVVNCGKEYLKRLVSQVANPVRWDLCMATMAEMGVTGILELPPAKTLTSIAKRNLNGVEVFNLNTPDDIPAAQEFVAKHGEVTKSVATPSWLLVVSPGKGEFQLATNISDRQPLGAETEIGKVCNLRDQMPVTMSEAGVITEWLVRDGDLVNPGQPIARIYPASEEGI